MHEQTGTEVQVTNDSLLPQDIGEFKSCVLNVSLAFFQILFSLQQGRRESHLAPLLSYVNR